MNWISSESIVLQIVFRPIFSRVSTKNTKDINFELYVFALAGRRMELLKLSCFSLLFMHALGVEYIE